jgi:hypothetical protein
MFGEMIAVWYMTALKNYRDDSLNLTKKEKE